MKAIFDRIGGWYYFGEVFPENTSLSDWVDFVYRIASIFLFRRFMGNGPGEFLFFLRNPKESRRYTDWY